MLGWEACVFSMQIVFKTSKQCCYSSRTNFISSFHFSIWELFGSELFFITKISRSSGLQKGCIHVFWYNITWEISGTSREFLSLAINECIDIVRRVLILILFLVLFLQIPSCLILQMPRFGSRYKMYDMILPNLELDVTHIVETGSF